MSILPTNIIFIMPILNGIFISINSTQNSSNSIPFNSSIRIDHIHIQ